MRLRKFIKSHYIVLLTVIVLPIVAMTGLYAVSMETIREANTLEQARRDEAAKIDAAIEALNVKKANDAKLAAQTKAAAEAAHASTEVQSAADATPGLSTTCSVNRTHGTATQLDVVVNKKQCISPLTYVPSDLTTVYGATLTAEASGQFSALYLAAAAAGVPLRVTSSFRSYDNQIATYQYWVGVNGQAGADTVSARPGYSEHQTGLALDLAAGNCSLECFADTAQYHWLQANAARYGFVERYPAGQTAVTGYSPEAWHYRYVGVETAQAMQARGVLTLEEYFDVPGGEYPG